MAENLRIPTHTHLNTIKIYIIELKKKFRNDFYSE